MDTLACDEKPPLYEALELHWRLLRDIGADLKDLYTLKRRTLAEGFAFLTKTLPGLGKAFDMGLGSASFKLPSSFKKWKKATEIPAFLGSLFRKVFWDNGQLRADADSSVVRAIRQCCFFFYKYEVPFSRESELEGYRKWIEVDSSLPEFFSLENDEILDRAANLTNDVFGDFAKRDLTFKHGPGAVSNCQRIDKLTYRPSHHDPIFQEFPINPTYYLSSEGDLSRLMGVTRAFFSASAPIPNYGESSVPSQMPSRLWLDVILHVSSVLCKFSAAEYVGISIQRYKRDIASKLITVPKDSRGGRIINKEPVHHQYYQQGIMKWTVKRIETHHYSSGCVNFTDQTVNRRLAVLASQTSEWATVDLKEASDRVSLALVKAIFCKCPEYLSALLATRTSHARIDTPVGEIDYQPKKFAAMGSAVCFTTLAWSIYVLLTSALMQGGWKLSEIKERVFVYGDDIVIPKDFFPYVSSVLEKYGLSVNKDKSFVGSSFAESCGMDAFKGVCVTPIRVRRLITSLGDNGVAKKTFDVSLSESIVKSARLANQLQKSGFCESANYVYTLVERKLGTPLPWGTEESPYLCRLCRPEEIGYLNASTGKFRKGRKRRFGTFSQRLNNRMEDYYHDKLVRIRGYGARAVFIDGPETPYSRLRRVLPTLGSPEKSGVPRWGEYADRGFTLERVDFYYDSLGSYQGAGISTRECPPVFGWELSLLDLQDLVKAF